MSVKATRKKATSKVAPRKRPSRAKGQVVLLRGRDRYGVQVGAAKKDVVRVALPMAATGEYSLRGYYLHVRASEVRPVRDQVAGRTRLLPKGFYNTLPARGSK